MRRQTRRIGDRLWGALLAVLGAGVLVVGGLIVAELIWVGRPLLGTGLVSFVFGREWDVPRESFGALPFIYGTVVTGTVALALAGPVSLGLALFLSEMASPRLKPWVTFPLQLLAGIPSVVVGLWGLFVLVPLMRSTVQPGLQAALGFLPFFQGAPLGLGLLTAGVLLAVMILPTITMLGLEVLATVPQGQREAAYALGATRWEMIRLSVLPYARPGLLGAVLLGLGRALGETMAVTMVIGNSPEIVASLFAPGYSLPAVIANEFAEASGDAAHRRARRPGPGALRGDAAAQRRRAPAGPARHRARPRGATHERRRAQAPGPRDDRAVRRGPAGGAAAARVASSGW